MQGGGILSSLTISNVKTIPLAFELAKEHWDAKYKFSERLSLLVKIETKNGLVGYGEAACFGGSQKTTTRLIDSELAPILRGRDPFLREQLWEELYQKTMQHGRGGVAIHALSGVDIALWDIVGKATSLPLYKLLGGAHDQLKAYASGGFYSHGKKTTDLIEEVRSYLDKGFKAVKIKIGFGSINESYERVKALVDNLPSQVDIMVDANGVLTPKQAVKLARKLEPLDISFIEEPVSPNNPEGSSFVRSMTTLNIAGFENCFTRFEYKGLLEKGAIDILQADATWCGGISEGEKITNLAETWNKPFIPHAYSSIVSLVSNMHLAASTNNATYMEVDQTPNALRTRLTKNSPLSLTEEGKLEMPQKPGLGIDIDEDALEEYSL